MPRILFDHNIPIGLRGLLINDEVTLAREMGWAQLGNGALLLAAERAGFDLLLTADKNLKYQQNLRARTLAIVVLGTNHWMTIRDRVDLIEAAVRRAHSTSFDEVLFS